MGTIWVPVELYEDKSIPEWFAMDEHVLNLSKCDYNCGECTSSIQRVDNIIELEDRFRQILGELGEYGVDKFLKPMVKGIRDTKPEKGLLNILEARVLVEACIRRS